MQRTKIRLLLTAAVCTLASSQMANAALTWSGSVGGAPTGVQKVNFDNLATGAGGGVATGPNGNVTVSFAPDGQAVVGSLSGQYAAPWLSGGNGTGFGSPNQANGVDASVYLTSGKNTVGGPNDDARVTLTFGSLQQYFGLLWGSIDLYNTLSFYNGNTLVGALTGGQVLAGANGDQGVNGTLYVNINSSVSFDRVVATSSEYAFELDNVAYSATPATPVPEPSTYFAGALLALLLGAQGARTLRSRTHTA